MIKRCRSGNRSNVMQQSHSRQAALSVSALCHSSHSVPTALSARQKTEEGTAGSAGGAAGGESSAMVNLSSFDYFRKVKRDQRVLLHTLSDTETERERDTNRWRRFTSAHRVSAE